MKSKHKINKDCGGLPHLNSDMQISWYKVHTKDTNRDLMDSNWPSIFFPSADGNMLAKTTSLKKSVAWPPFLAIRRVMNVPRNATQEGTCRPGGHNDLLHII